ncbi:hypothetical protein HFZ78_19160 [Priestia megaterium]|uniref:Lipoprotein n=1 Tax=Priestia megaterium TaxID=1404 RepID=A0A6H1P4X4_PRIMG|nr:hypothetical protein [Priestia megaterium]QIZ08568.1 hypothetical protein HFZ78_19160 [Priestia megaterium]
MRKRKIYVCLWFSLMAITMIACSNQQNRTNSTTNQQQGMLSISNQEGIPQQIEQIRNTIMEIQAENETLKARLDAVEGKLTTQPTPSPNPTPTPVPPTAEAIRADMQKSFEEWYKTTGLQGTVTVTYNLVDSTTIYEPAGSYTIKFVGIGTDSQTFLKGLFQYATDHFPDYNQINYNYNYPIVGEAFLVLKKK